MEMPRRHGFKWTINEILQLQREYELLKLTVDEMAVKHERTSNSIIQKIIEEDFLYSDEEEYEDENTVFIYHHEDENTVFIYNNYEVEEEEEDHEEEEEDEDEDIIIFRDESCITEKKELVCSGSPQYTINAYEYLRNSFIGFFFNTKKEA